MTISEVVFLEEAISDLEEGRQFYEDIEEGIEIYFTDSLLVDAVSLQLYAGSHLIHYGYFRILVKRFPLSVYYGVENESARVVAILEMRQNPLSIRKVLNAR
ncbi:MAG: type II toxin-antitoxin system RelE/ParE family toxin [Verrucomicrobia bacterium]|nr:type II toxin-antitoxin system RelE/ParE family toxin [Verrucomicrobiota bacterium]